MLTECIGTYEVRMHNNNISKYIYMYPNSQIYLPKALRIIRLINIIKLV